MIDSFDNPQFIAQKFNELQQALQNPNIIAHFGKIDPISPRFKSQNSDHINYINWEKIQHYFVEGRKLMPLSFPQTNLVQHLTNFASHEFCLLSFAVKAQISAIS